MGEISDALKKANEEKASPGERPDADDRKPASPALPSADRVEAGDPMGAHVLAAMQRGHEAAAPPPRGHSAGARAAVRPRDLPQTERRLVEMPGQPTIGDAATDLAHSVAPQISHLEHLRHVALRVGREFTKHDTHCLAVVSALRNEGKTTVACNLAIAMATLSPERSICMLDLDLRNPSIAGHLKLKSRLGIESVLLGEARLEDVCHSYLRPPIDVYPAIIPQRGAHELLVGPRFERMLQTLESRYLAVIIDTPPTVLVPDSTLILRQGAVCVCVARKGQSSVRRFKEMLDILPEAQVIGKLLNCVPEPKHAQDDYYYYAEEE